MKFFGRQTWLCRHMAWLGIVYDGKNRADIGFGPSEVERQDVCKDRLQCGCVPSNGSVAGPGEFTDLVEMIRRKR